VVIARRALLAGFVLLILAGIASGQVDLSLLASLATLAAVSYAFLTLVDSLTERLKPAPTAQQHDQGDAPDPDDDAHEGLGVGTAMSYDECLVWLLEYIGEPVAVTLGGRDRPGPTWVDVPTVRVKGRLDHADPDPDVDQSHGEALEFVVGDHGSFSIGRREFRHAERSDDESSRGALLDFEGGMVFIVVPAEVKSLDGAP
jgi:hypothetical protein